MNPKKAIAVLRAAFRVNDFEEPTIRLYEESIRDIPPALLSETVQRLVQHSRFFPSIAEIRDTAAAISGLLPAGAQEALEVIRQADAEESVYRRDGSLAYTERYWRWPEGISPATWLAIKATLARVGDPVRKDERVFAWDGDFKKVYEGQAKAIGTELTKDIGKALVAVKEQKALPWRADRALAEGIDRDDMLPENRRKIKEIIDGLSEDKRME